MTEEIDPKFAETIMSCIIELSQDLSLPCTEVSNEQDAHTSKEESIAAVIGYSSPEIKGSMTVISTKELLKQTHPNLQMGIPVGEQEIEDWVGEISNQLLGRVKNKLLKFGTSVSMATPSILAGTSLASRSPREGSRIRFKCGSDLGSLGVVVDVIPAPGFKFIIVDSSNSATKKEGASILF